MARSPRTLGKPFSADKLLVLLLALCPGFIQATTPLEPDPACRTPDLLDGVNLRREAARRDLARNRIRPAASSVRPGLRAEWEAATARPLLRMYGQSGTPYQLLASSSIHGPWEPAFGFVLSGQEQRWSDAHIGSASSRFYKLAEAAPLEMEPLASNFRLIDLDGESRELYYHTHRQAVVLVAAGDRLENLAPLLGELNRLHSQNPTGHVEIWVLLSDTSTPRERLRAQAHAMGIRLPVLVDRDQMVARVLGLGRTAECAVVRTSDFVTVYRGAVRQDNSSLLDEALTAIRTGRRPAIWQTLLSTLALPSIADEVPDYGRDIAPILRTYCARCHRPGDVAPFAFTNYAEVQSRITAIHHQVMSGNMPPWDADPEHGRFVNSLAMPSEARRKLIAWLGAGAPRGPGRDPLEESPTAARFLELPADLGEPDAVMALPVQHVKATGTEPYRTFPLRSPNTTNVWLRGAAVVPGNRAVVHHFIAYQPLPADLVGEINVGFSMYVPGRAPTVVPAGTGMYLGQSTPLLFELHYTPNGRPATDEPKLYLWYHRERPAKTFRTFTVVNQTFSIPPGERSHAVKASHRFEQPVTIHSLANHMHVRGRSMKIEAVRPDGSRETLLSVPRYRFNWQLRYEMAEPMPLPAGTIVEVTGSFDNSPQNPSNPDPAASVTWGQQTWEEMFMGVLEISE